MSSIKVEIAQESVQEVIQNEVRLAVLAAMDPHKEKLMAEIVNQSLLAKSQDNGYRYKKDHEVPTVLEHMVRQMIREEAEKGIKEWVQGHRVEIAEKIRKQMATQRFGKALAYQVVEQLCDTDFRFHMTVTPVHKE